MADELAPEGSPVSPTEQPKTPDDLLRRWRSKVKAAQKLREWWETKYRVKDCEMMFLGDRGDALSSSLNVNYFFATVKAIQPNLFFSDPRFLVRPKQGKTPDSEAHVQAAVAEALLTSIARQDFNLEIATKLALQQAFLRLGILKVIYNPKLEPNPQAGQPISDAMGQPIDIEPPFIVDDDCYLFQWVNAMNMLLPDQGPDMTRWTWIGEEVVVPIEEAKTDERFDPALREMLKSNERGLTRKEEQHHHSSMGHNESADEDGVLRYFEIYDIVHKQWLIWADEQDFDQFLVFEGTPPGIEDHPYAILQGWTPISSPDPLPWPFPHTRPWIDLQNEYNIRRQQITQGAKRSARKIYYDKATFVDSDEAHKSLQSSRDMEAVEIQDTQRPPVTLVDPELPQGIFNDTQLLIQDWRVVTGQTGARLADAEKSTATEANFIEKAASLRDVDMRSAVSHWLATAGRKMFQLIKQTMTLEKIIQIRGLDDKAVYQIAMQYYGIQPEMFVLVPNLMEIIKARFGQMTPLSVSREELQFEADVDVVPGSTRPRTLPEERKDWIEFLTVIGQFPQLMMSRELLAETASKYEFINERMIDELNLMARMLVEVNARQAGREGQQPNPSGK